MLLGRFLFRSQRFGQAFNHVFHDCRNTFFYFRLDGGSQATDSPTILIPGIPLLDAAD